MKKVLALVLALVMVCTLAMAADYTDQKYDFYRANATNMKAGKIAATTDNDKVLNKGITSVAAANNSNGSGALAYLEIEDDAVNKYVKTTTPTTSDYAVTKTGEKDILFYLAKIDAVAYDATAKEFTNFGTGCGQVLNTTNSKYYELTNSADKGKVYKVFATGDTAGKTVLVDGKLVELANANATNPHNWIVSGVGMKNNVAVPTEVSCAVCKAKATVYEAGKAPAGTDPVAVPGNYVGYVYVVPTAATTTTTTTNPDTGANDVIGVAAALAVVALVSGAAISLKK